MAKRPPAKKPATTPLLKQRPVRKAVPKNIGKGLDDSKIKVSPAVKKLAAKKVAPKKPAPRVDPRLLGKNGKPLVGAALKMRLDKIRASGERPPEAHPVDRNGRPLAGNALRMWQMKRDRQHAAAPPSASPSVAEPPEDNVEDQIAAAAAQAIQAQLDAEEAHRRRMMDLRDRKRIVKHKMRVRALRKQQEQQQRAEQAQVENTASSMRERVEEWRINRGDNYASEDYETEVADTATALDNWTGPVITGLYDIEHDDAPSDARKKPRRRWRRNRWDARGYPKPWEDPEQIAMMTEHGVPPEDSPTTNPRNRSAKIEQDEVEAAEKIAEVIGEEIEEVLDRKKSKRKAKTEHDETEDPEHVILVPKDNKELFDGLDHIGNVGQDLADTMSDQFKQEERARRRKELDAKRKAGRDDDFGGLPSGFRNAAAMAASGPKQLLGEIGSVLKNLVGVGGILGTLWAAKENFDRAPRVMNSITKGFKGVLAGAYDLLGMNAEAQQLRDEANSILDKDLASGKDAAIVGGTGVGLAAMTKSGRWALGRLMSKGWQLGKGLATRANLVASASMLLTSGEDEHNRVARERQSAMQRVKYSDPAAAYESGVQGYISMQERKLGRKMTMEEKADILAQRLSGRHLSQFFDNPEVVDKNSARYKENYGRALEFMKNPHEWQMPQAPANGAGAFAVGTSQKDLMGGTYQAFRRAGLSHEGALAHTAEIGREGAFLGKNVFGTHVDPKNKALNSGFMSWQGSRRTALMARLKAKGLLSPTGEIIPGQEALDEMARFSVEEMANGSKEQQETLAYLQRDGINANQAMDMLGRNHIKWRIDDPQYRSSGIRNRTGFYNEAAKLTGQGHMQQVPNEVTPFQSKESVQPPGPSWDDMKRQMGVGAGTVPLASNRGDMPSLSSNYVDDMLLVAINGGAIT